MRILLLGKNGQLGWELQRALAPLGVVSALDINELDLEDLDAVRRTIRELGPQVIVNAAAYTAVDRAENEPEKAFKINGTLPGVLAEEARALNAALVHYSTDYVFDGKKGTAYSEADTPNPLGVYGASKLAGERAVQSVDGVHLILRTAWVYSLRRDSFVTKVLQWARQNETLRIVDDQISNPTWARMLAETTALLLARGADSSWIAERKGLYHLAGQGWASRLEWAKQILALDPAPLEQKARELVAARTADFPTPAERPLFSALDCKRFNAVFDFDFPAWKAALEMAMST